MIKELINKIKSLFAKKDDSKIVNRDNVKYYITYKDRYGDVRDHEVSLAVYNSMQHATLINIDGMSIPKEYILGRKRVR